MHPARKLWHAGVLDWQGAPLISLADPTLLSALAECCVCNRTAISGFRGVRPAYCITWSAQPQWERACRYVCNLSLTQNRQVWRSLVLAGGNA